MMLRRFNSSGLAAFRMMLSECRNDSGTRIQRDYLADSKYTSIVSNSIEVMHREFQTRDDAARHFESLLSPISDFEVERDAGLWSWLSLFYFDQICPRARDGSRRVNKDYQYIFEPMSRQYRSRHLLFVGWKVLKLDPDHCRLFLYGPVSQLDKVTSEVLGRLYLTRIPCILEVLDRLYWDPIRGKSRKGIVSPQIVARGDLMHRLPVRIRQLEKTYDLMSLTADQLLELLGQEFSFAGSKSLELFD